MARNLAKRNHIHDLNHIERVS